MLSNLYAMSVSAVTPLVLEVVTPTPPADFDETTVTPTWVGFAFTAGFALIVVLLGLDFTRRVRRMRYRAEIREALADELAAKEAADAAQGEPGKTSVDTNSTDGGANGAPDKNPRS